MGLFSLAYQIGAMNEVSEEEALEFMKEFEELIDDIDAFGIFSHNVMLSLVMFIPGFGVGWGLFSAWSTGFGLAAITMMMPEFAQLTDGNPLFSLTLLYLTPFGCWPENWGFQAGEAAGPELSR